MYEAPLSIAGHPVLGSGWTHVLRAGDTLRDPRAAFALRVELDRGRIAPTPAVIGRVALAGPEDNTRAVAAAAAALEGWSAVPAERRWSLLDRFRAAIVARKDELVELLVHGEGHPQRLAEWEVSGMIAGTSPSVNRWVRDQFEHRARTRDREVRLVRKADGVVCLAPPKNAAAANAAMGVSCLAAGNTLVVKAPKSAPLVVAWLYREIVIPLLDALGAPPGTANVVCGNAAKIVDEWVEDPRVDDIFFFGDSKVGLELGGRCWAQGKKAVLELSGNDAVIVWKDADVERAADAIAECFLGSGQICMVPKHTIVHRDVADALCAAVAARARALRPGLPDTPGVVLSPVLRHAEYTRCIDELVAAGGRLLCGGARLDLEGRPSVNGLFCAPSVVRTDDLDVAARLPAFREETFFPVMPIAVANDLGSMLRFVQQNRFGLRNSLWARDPRVIDAFTTQVRSGGLLKVNTSHVGFEPLLATHGGTGRTTGPGGELNYPALRTSHLQGIAVARVGLRETARAALARARSELAQMARGRLLAPARA